MHVTLEWSVIIGLIGVAITLATLLWRFGHKNTEHQTAVTSDLKHIKEKVDGISDSMGGRVDKLTVQVNDHETRITVLENKIK